MFSDSKGEMLQKIQTLLGINQEHTITIGDGANDLSMFKYAKTKVAFCAKECLKNEATVCIEEKDLRLLCSIKFYKFFNFMFVRLMH